MTKVPLIMTNVPQCDNDDDGDDGDDDEEEEEEDGDDGDDDGAMMVLYGSVRMIVMRMVI
jgi:hypothetical protein